MNSSRGRSPEDKRRVPAKSEQCWSRLSWQRIHTRSGYHAGPLRTRASSACARMCVCMHVWQMSMRVIRCVYIVLHPWLHMWLSGELRWCVCMHVCVSPGGTYYYSCLFMSLPSLPACATRTHTHMCALWLIVSLASTLTSPDFPVIKIEAYLHFSSVSLRRCSCCNLWKIHIKIIIIMTRKALRVQTSAQHHQM